MLAASRSMCSLVMCARFFAFNVGCEILKWTPRNEFVQPVEKII